MLTNRLRFNCFIGNKRLRDEPRVAFQVSFMFTGVNAFVHLFLWYVKLSIDNFRIRVKCLFRYSINARLIGNVVYKQASMFVYVNAFVTFDFLFNKLNVNLNHSSIANWPVNNTGAILPYVANINNLD
jgi:hypothetical protein